MANKTISIHFDVDASELKVFTDIMQKMDKLDNQFEELYSTMNKSVSSTHKVEGGFKELAKTTETYMKAMDKLDSYIEKNTQSINGIENASFGFKRMLETLGDKAEGTMDSFGNFNIVIQRADEVLNRLSGKVNEETGEFEQFSSKIEVVTDESKKMTEAFEKISTTFANSQFDSATKETQEYIEAQEKARVSTGKFIADGEKLIPVQKENAQATENVTKKVKAQGEQTGKTKTKMKGLHESMKGLNKYQMTFADATRIATERMVQWATASNLIYGINRMLRGLTDTVVQLDTQLTDLRKVMPDDTDFGAVFETANTTAQNFGRTLDDVLDSYNNFAQMGYNDKQMQTMANATALMSNVSNLDMDTASESLISTINAYGLEVKDAQMIVDMFNKTQNNFAIGTDDLAESFKRAGATANTFGVGVESLIGHTTAIKEVTRSSGSEIGNALKTIYSRITTMEKSYESLESVGVKSFDEQTGAVRPIEAILGDLAGVWGSLSDEQKQNMAVTIAGRQQLSKFIALMDNYDTALESSDASADSWNSAMEENKKYMESLQAKIDGLKSSLMSLADTVGKSGFKNIFGGLLEAGKTGIDGLTEMLTTSASRWGTLLTVALGSSFGGIGKAYTGLLSNNELLMASVGNMTSRTAKFSQALQGYFGVAMGNADAMSITLGNLATKIGGFIKAIATNPITWAAIAVTSIVAVAGAYKEAQAEHKKLLDDSEAAKQSFKEFKDAISSGGVTQYQIEEFTTKIDKSKEALKELTTQYDDYVKKQVKKIKTNATPGYITGDSSDSLGDTYGATRQLAEANKDLEDSYKALEKQESKNATMGEVLDQNTKELLASLGMWEGDNEKVEEGLSRISVEMGAMETAIQQAEESMKNQVKQGLAPMTVEYENLDDAITNTTSSLESYSELMLGRASGTADAMVQQTNAYYKLLDKQREGMKLTTVQAETLALAENGLANEFGLSSEALKNNEKYVKAVTEARQKEQQALETYLAEDSNENEQLYEKAEKKRIEAEKRLENIAAMEIEKETKKQLASAGIKEEETSANLYKDYYERREKAIIKCRETHGTEWDKMTEKEKESLAALQEQKDAYDEYIENYADGDKVAAEINAKKMARLYGEEDAYNNLKKTVETAVSETQKQFEAEAEAAESSSQRIQTANEEAIESQEELTTAVNTSAQDLTTAMTQLYDTINGIAKRIGDAMDNISNSFKLNGEGVSGTVSAINNAIESIGGQIDKLTNAVKDKTGNIANAFNGMYTKTKDKMEGTGKNLDSIKEKFNKLHDSVLGKYGSVIRAFMNMYTASEPSMSKTETKIKNIKSAWDNLEEAMDDVTIEGNVKVNIGFGGIADPSGGLDGSKVMQEAKNKILGTSISGRGFGGYRLTSKYGRRVDPITGRAGSFHDGIDLAGPIGSPIHARKGGRVAYAGWLGGYGNYIKIASANGLETFYGHLNSIKVKTGQYISAGSLIGTMGSTGRSTGSHLHFGAHLNGSSINPMPYYHQGGIVSKKPRQNEVDTRLQVGEMVLTQKQQKRMFDVLNQTTSLMNGRGIQEAGGGYSNPYTGMGGVYTVKKGDTLSAIAQRYYGNAYSGGLTSLLKLNPNIKNANQLSVGQKINVPGSSTSTAKKTSTTKKVTYSKDYSNKKTESIFDYINKMQGLNSNYDSPSYLVDAMLKNRKYFVNADTDKKNQYNETVVNALKEYTNMSSAKKLFNSANLFGMNSSQKSGIWKDIQKSINENIFQKFEDSTSSWLDKFNSGLKEAHINVGLVISAFESAQNRIWDERTDDFVSKRSNSLLSALGLDFEKLTEAEKIEKRMEDLQQKIQTRAEETATLEWRLASDKDEKRLAELKGYINTLNKQISDTATNMKKSGITNGSLIAEAQEPLREKLAEIKAEYNELSNAIAQSNKIIANNQSEMKDLADEYKKLESQLESMTSKQDFTDIWGNLVYSTDGAVTQITKDGQLIMNTLSTVQNALNGLAGNESIKVIANELSTLVGNVAGGKLEAGLVSTGSTSSTSSSTNEKQTYSADTNVIRNVTYVVQTGVALASESELKEFAMLIKDMIDEENSRGE